MKKYIVALIALLCINICFAQDKNILAKIAYEDAETAYAAGNFIEAIDELKKVDSLLGKKTPKSQYLRVQVWLLAAEQNPANIDGAITICKDYLNLSKSFDIPEEKVIDVTRKLLKLEKSKEVIIQKKKDEEAAVKEKENALKERARYMKSLGGMIVTESNGHGLIMANADIGKMNLKEAKKACEDLVLNNYDDWRLPTLAEFNQMLVIYYQILKVNPPQFLFTNLSGNYHVIDETKKLASKDFFVRPVRNF
jgi:hypothetical protein